MTENDVLDKGGQAVIWPILRIVLAIYLVVGFFVYLRSDHRVVDPSDQPEGQRSSQKGTLLQIIKIILLWPGFLGRGQKD